MSSSRRWSERESERKSSDPEFLHSGLSDSDNSAAARAGEDFRWLHSELRRRRRARRDAPCLVVHGEPRPPFWTRIGGHERYAKLCRVRDKVLHTHGPVHGEGGCSKN